MLLVVLKLISEPIEFDFAASFWWCGSDISQESSERTAIDITVEDLSEDVSLSLASSISATSASDITRAQTSPTPNLQSTQTSITSQTSVTSHSAQISVTHSTLSKVDSTVSQSTLTSQSVSTSQNDGQTVKKPRKVRMPAPESLPSDFRKVALKPAKIVHHEIEKPKLEVVDLKPTPTKVEEAEADTREKVTLKHLEVTPERGRSKSPSRQLAEKFDKKPELDIPLKLTRRSRTPSRFDDLYFQKEESPTISRASTPVSYKEGEVYSHIKMSGFAHTQLMAGGSYNAAFLVRCMKGRRITYPQCALPHTTYSFLCSAPDYYIPRQSNYVWVWFFKFHWNP